MKEEDCWKEIFISFRELWKEHWQEFVFNFSIVDAFCAIFAARFNPVLASLSMVVLYIVVIPFAMRIGRTHPLGLALTITFFWLSSQFFPIPEGLKRVSPILWESVSFVISTMTMIMILVGVIHVPTRLRVSFNWKGNPIKKASVTMVGPRTVRRGLTDLNGQIKFEDIPEGDYMIFADKVNYGKISQTISVMEGTNTEDFIFPPRDRPDLILHTDQSQISIPQEGSDIITITLTSLGGFAGEVKLSIMGIRDSKRWWMSMKGIKSMFPTMDFNPEIVTLSANVQASSTLTLRVDSATKPDAYILWIRAINLPTPYIDQEKTVLIEVKKKKQSSKRK